MELQLGQKLKLDTLTGGRTLDIRLTLEPPAQTDVDISCLGLDAERTLSDEQYFVFYNRKESPCGGVKLDLEGPGKGRFAVDLERLPPKIRRLVFVATLDGAAGMSGAGAGRFAVSAGGAEVASFAFEGKSFASERALMVAELYIKGPEPDTQWRLAVVGQGFEGGLAALLEHFGGTIAAPEREPEPPPPPPKVSLGKLTLEKRGDAQKISLEKGAGGAPTQPIHINLNWTVPSAKGLGGILGMKKSADLDLGCMFELVTGERGVIQPLGNRFGARAQPPYILLDQDDRSGASAGGENMYLYRPDVLKRCVIFAMIYEGTSNFTEVQGRVTVDDGRGSEITVVMNAPHPRLTFCAVCLLESEGGALKVQKEEMYFSGHPECDKHYGFGFRWVAGSK